MHSRETDVPRLSVVMPMRDCGRSVRAMLDSLPHQRIPMQVVIVDDASEDDSVARVEAWSRQTGHPVDLVRNERQLYSYTSRLKGLARATAPVIWCVDADDCIPPQADVAAALDIMERERADILHARACGVAAGSRLQQILPWTEPFAERLSGGDIFAAFITQSYPPATLCNKFFSARLVREVLAAAPDISVRYFDVKFLGLLFLLYAQRYVACNELIYEYRMRAHRPAWLYARQVDALRLLEEHLAPRVAERAPDQLAAFRAYCRRRSVIQAGHLSLMAEAELKALPAPARDAGAWLAGNLLSTLAAGHLCCALCRSLAANASRLSGWERDLRKLSGADGARTPGVSAASLMENLRAAVREWLEGDAASVEGRMATAGMRLGLELARANNGGDEAWTRFPEMPAEAAVLPLLLANARLARAITAILAPDIDITKKAN